ncbi:MAG: ABC transporter permease, partial [Streptosporangiaceae bacterium]
MPIWGMVLSALAEIRVGKVRVALSAFCVVCLVATVTLVVALASLSQQAAQQYFEEQGGRPGTYEMYLSNGEGRNGPAPIPAGTIDTVRQDLKRYRITGAIESFSRNAKIRHQGQILTTAEQNGPPAFMLMAVDSELGSIRALKLVAGRWLTRTDDLRMEPQLVVSKGFAVRLGLTPATAVGTELELASQEVWVRSRIVGVLDIGSEDPNYGQPPQVYLPYAVSARWGISGDETKFYLRMPPTEAKPAIAQLKNDGRLTWNVKEVGIQRAYQSFDGISSKLKLVMLAAALAILMVGSLPALVLGIFAVRQRRSEFGVHRCFGATGSDLFLIVLLEALIVCTVSGVIGVALAYVAQAKVSARVLPRITDRGGPPGSFHIDTSF